MRSLNPTAPAAVRETYENHETETERDAYAAGYNHAQGIAHRCVPQAGKTYWTESRGYFTSETLEELQSLHATLCYEAESDARCYSPWEQIAAEINALGEGETEIAWEAYEDGVADAIAHDLAGYDATSYGLEP